jgi:hypothetical protein
MCHPRVSTVIKPEKGLRVDVISERQSSSRNKTSSCYLRGIFCGSGSAFSVSHELSFNPDSYSEVLVHLLYG